MKAQKKRSALETLRLLVVGAMLGSLMFISDILMEFLPNMHIVGALIITFTVVYRSWALVPIYVYVFLNGFFGGFGLWWYPYLYIWLPLWGMAMLIPCRLSPRWRVPLYMVICALHGFAFGVLYAPLQMFAFNFTPEMTVKWIIAGLPFDFIHGSFNFVAAMLVLPVSRALELVERKTSFE